MKGGTLSASEGIIVECSEGGGDSAVHRIGWGHQKRGDKKCNERVLYTESLDFEPSAGKPRCYSISRMFPSNRILEEELIERRAEVVVCIAG